MMRPHRRMAVLAASAVSVAVLSGCGLLKDGAYDLPLPGGPDAGSNPKIITVHFDSVDGLVPKSMVKVGNIAVGEVEQISVDQRNWTVTVVCKIRSDVALPANATAQARRSSLLGEWFVELSPPARGASPAALGNGASIPMARTQETAPVEEVLGALSLLLSDGGVPQLNTIVRELNTAFAGRSGQIRSLLTTLNTFTGQLDGHKGDIVSALKELNRLSGTLNDNRTKIAAAIDELPAGVKVLAEQRGQIVTLVRSLGRLSDVAVHVVEKSRANTAADLRALQPVLANLAAAGSNLPHALQIALSYPFTPAATAAVRGDFANLATAVDLNAADLIRAMVRGGASSVTGLLPNPTAILGSPGRVPRASGPAPTTAPSPIAAPTPKPAGKGLTGLLGLLGLGGQR